MDTLPARPLPRSSPSIAVRRAADHSVHADLLFLPAFHSFSALADPAKAPRSISPPSLSALFHSLEDLGSFGKDSDSDGFFLPFDSPPSTSPSSPYTLADTTPGAYFEPSAPRAMQESSLPPTRSSYLAPLVPKKRPSLQSIFTPAFLQQPPSISLVSPVTRPRSRVRSQSASSNVAQQLSAASSSRTSSKATSPRDSPPPEYLIDEDPFAALSPSPIAGPSTSSYLPKDSWYDVGDISSSDSGPYPSFGQRSPRSPRQRSRTNPPSPTGIISRPFPRRSFTKSTAPAPNPRRPVPAHARPAFASRPSLPSLRALAQADFVYPIKARKGTLGARLPVEPWNMDQEPEVSSPATSTILQHPSADPSTHASSPNTLHSNREQLPSDNVNALSPDTVPDGVSLNVAGQPLGDTASHVFSEEETDLAYTQSSASLEADAHYDADDSADDMFSSFINALSTLSSPSHSRSSSQSSSSTFSPILSSPESISRSTDGISRGSSESDRSEFGIIHSVLDEYDNSPACDFDDATRDVARRSIPISPRPGRTPHNSISHMPGGFPGLDDFTPGTSLDTIRASVTASTMPAAANRMSVASIGDEEWFSSNEDDLDMLDLDQSSDGEPVDAGDSHYGGSRSNGQSTSGGDGGGRREHSDPRGAGRSYGNESAGGSGSGQGGRDGRDGDRRDLHHNGVPPSYTTSGDTESSDDEDQPPKPTATRRQRPSVTSSRAQVASASTAVADDESSDDDVPLAQRIPTALKAQRTIRRQVRDETDQRRKERAIRRLQDALSADVSFSAGPSPDASRRPSRDVPRAPGSPKAVPAPEPTVFAPTGSLGRARTQTLPGNMSRPFALDALAEKLAKVSANSTPPTSFRRPSHPPDDVHITRHSESGGDEQSHSLPRERTLKPMRSFHRTNMPDHAMSTPDPAPMPVQSTSRTLGRSSTSARRPKRDESQTRPGTSDEPLRTKSIKRHKSIDDSARGRSGTLSLRTSTDNDAVRAHRPPVPAVPPAEILSALLPAGAATQPVATHTSKSQVAWQQRVFVGDMQRFNMVEIGPTTTSKEVIEMLDGQAQLEQWVGAGGWMLYEVAQDFGMERPIRNFEVVADIVNSWDKDRTVNMLVARKTVLASLLHSSAMPASSPVHQGYVEWESKRGKWNKRWLELKEHSLWLSKRDNGKDSTFLCSLSNFDAYQVTRPHKAPKSFVFAVKSTDNLTFFENAADYVHIFSCLDKEGQNWLEKLLVARSYIINQERNIITSASTGPAAPSSKSLSRAGTRKGTRPTQPLVGVSAPQPGLAAATPGDKVFAPGSLLGQR